jgi:hypothetical protein
MIGRSAASWKTAAWIKTHFTKPVVRVRHPRPPHGLRRRHHCRRNRPPAHGGVDPGWRQGGQSPAEMGRAIGVWGADVPGQSSVSKPSDLKLGAYPVGEDLSLGEGPGTPFSYLRFKDSRMPDRRRWPPGTTRRPAVRRVVGDFSIGWRRGGSGSDREPGALRRSLVSGKGIPSNIAGLPTFSSGPTAASTSRGEEVDFLVAMSAGSQETC